MAVQYPALDGICEERRAVITLITGGSKCGKSALAEELLSKCSGRRVYIAAMQPFGEGADEIISRHRKMRSGKGFETIELYRNFSSDDIPSGCCRMIEDIANLTANEMFFDDKVCDPFYPVMQDIKTAAERTEHLIIVSNSVGCDGIVYPEETAAYIRSIGRINAALAALSDNAIECVFGIPVVLKGRIPC